MYLDYSGNVKIGWNLLKDTFYLRVTVFLLFFFICPKFKICKTPRGVGLFLVYSYTDTNFLGSFLLDYHWWALNFVFCMPCFLMAIETKAKFIDSNKYPRISCSFFHLPHWISSFYWLFCWIFLIFLSVP